METPLHNELEFPKRSCQLLTADTGRGFGSPKGVEIVTGMGTGIAGLLLSTRTGFLRSRYGPNADVLSK